MIYVIPNNGISICCLKGAMTAAEVKCCEEIANNRVSRNEEVFAKETALSTAKAIQGLRAVFDEVCPLPSPLQEI